MSAECRNCGHALKGPARYCNVCGVPREELLPETRSGIAAFEAGEYLEALAWFEKSLHKGPASCLRLRDSGHAAFHLQKTDLALKRYEAALKLHTRLLDVRYNLGVLHMGKGRVNEAWRS